MVCSDCHNPHGSAGPHALKEFTVNETCYNCHADKRGPMLWEHQPVREDCINCHTPHGSTQARLMKEHMGFMCSSCHSAVSNNSGGAFGGAHAMPGNLLGTATLQQRLGEPAVVPELSLAGPRVEQPERRLLLPLTSRLPRDRRGKGAEMRQKFALRAMLLSGVCLLPLTAMGADLRPTTRRGAASPASFTENEVEFGVLGLWGTNTGQYGRYNGFTEQGVDATVRLQLPHASPVWDSNGTMYWEFTGDNIDFQFGDDLGTSSVSLPPGGGQCQTNSFKDSDY